MRVLLYLVIIICVLIGLYKMIIDDEKGVGYASFIFAILVFIFTLIPTDTPKPPDNEDQETEISDEEEKTDLETQTDTEITNQDNTSNTSNTENQTDIKQISGRSFSGSIKNDGQEDRYVYIPDVSGVYRFDFDSSDANTNYKFDVYSSSGERMASSYYINKGKSVELIAEQQYTIVVMQYLGEMQYTVTIGVPNRVDIVNGTDINGILTYSDQKDEHVFTAPITGQYRFDFSGSDVQCDYRFNIYAPDNERLASAYYSNEGKTVVLTEGEQYTIVVEQYSGYLSYNITIGVPNKVKEIDGSSFSGSILYTDQLDSYTYAAPVTGTYRFDLVSDDVQCNYQFCMYGSDNKQLAVTYYSKEGKTVDLEAGEVYKIEIKQHSGLENYIVNIGVPNNISKVEGDIISGTIAYIDQENIYTYIAPVSGQYTFTFGISDVDNDYGFYVISPINEQLVSARYKNNSRTVQLEEGQMYTIKIKQNLGLPSYQINITIEQ